MPNNPAWTNHLVGQNSPYLLQHIQNPVDWYPWGTLALNKAKAENKPVLLSIGYSTCHWCHVMAHESFEDVDIAKIINDKFIAIKVDREERPDIDHIYMTATTAMTGQGGWPLTVFLTPHGEPFYAGTYFPPYAKWGSVGFVDLLNSIANAWVSDHENILSSSRSITESLRRNTLSDTMTDALILDVTILDKAFRHLRGQFDPIKGGFGKSPKFPMGHNLSFLLRYYQLRNNSEALEMVEKSLTQMSRGGIWDHLGGGFHRYSTDQNWHVPHFEKMLYDQALLTRAYLEAYQITGNVEYAQIGHGILEYVLNEMTDSQGGFYSAEDADSLDVSSGHLKEGAFYVFSQNEIDDALGKDTAKIFNYCYGVMPQGNVVFDPHEEFVGKNILFKAHSAQDAAAEFHRHPDEIQGILNEAVSKLLIGRNQRHRPHRDDKVLCDWNGLMIASFAFASRVLGEERYAKIASKAADFVLTQMMVNDRLLHRWRQGEAGIEATLDDYAFIIYGLIELYEATFNVKYLEAAKRLTDTMIEFFADQAGGFFMTASDAEILIIRPKEAYDGALPSGNSVAALILLRLQALTKKETYLTQINNLFNSFASSVDRAPYAHGFLLSALYWHLQGPVEITFKGNFDDIGITNMVKVLYKNFMPLKAVNFIEDKKVNQALICFRGTCKLPIINVLDFEKEILSGMNSI